MTKEQESAAYYAVVPAPVRYDPDLSPSAKLLFCEITSLCRAKGYCWATNSYFTQLFNLSASTISRLISQLERRGHIAIQTAATETGSERHIYTDIYQVERLSEGIPEGGTQKQQAPPGGAQKAQGGVRKNGKGGVSKNRKQNDLTVNDLTEDPPCSPPAGDAPPDSVPVCSPVPSPVSVPLCAEWPMPFPEVSVSVSTVRASCSFSEAYRGMTKKPVCTWKPVAFLLSALSDAI